MSGDMIPVKMEMSTCSTSIVQNPDWVMGTKKKATLSTSSTALTRMNVVFLPSLLATGTQRATPAMLDTSPILRKSPA